MKLSDFDYNLPEKLIAQTPKKVRSDSKILVLNKKNGNLKHCHFYDLSDFLKKGDLLVANNSKVFPARLLGNKETGGAVEIFLISEIEPGKWQTIGKNLSTDSKITFKNSDLIGIVLNKVDNLYEVGFNISGEDFFKELEKIGTTPLPPYIKRKSKTDDQTRMLDRGYYQTVYAKERGSVAAPTAGLHFTKDLIEKLKNNGIGFAELTLHVGLGTFAPVKENDILKHKMHKEFFSISKKEYDKIIQAKKEKRRVIAIGTTTTRVLEHLFNPKNNKLIPQDYSGSTDIFIYPGYEFKCINGLITNFHLPKSTLLLLISAFAGKKNIDNAYGEAIKKEYEFYSYGDAMLII